MGNGSSRTSISHIRDANSSLVKVWVECATRISDDGNYSNRIEFRHLHNKCTASFGSGVLSISSVGNELKFALLPRCGNRQGVVSHSNRTKLSDRSWRGLVNHSINPRLRKTVAPNQYTHCSSILWWNSDALSIMVMRSCCTARGHARLSVSHLSRREDGQPSLMKFWRYARNSNVLKHG